MSRSAQIARRTGETDVKLSLDLDGGEISVASGVGFLDHMLELLARHGRLGLTVEAKGDLATGAHHTTEDVGIALGQAVRQALGDKAGIRRYASSDLPMDGSLTRVALDVSGRPYLVWNVRFSTPKIGEMDTELFEEFFRALSSNGLFALHVMLRHGHNAHHVAEGCFKAVARALRQAVEPDPRAAGAIPSTKGMLEA